jgi:LasA protease
MVNSPRSKLFCLFSTPLLLLAFLSMACGRRIASTAESFNVTGIDLPATIATIVTATAETPGLAAPHTANILEQKNTPTPDDPHPLPTLRNESEEYVVKAGDTLMSIAQRYQVGLQAVVEANELANPDYLEIGQILVIPEQIPSTPGTGFKVIPDSELVYSPTSIGFEVEDYVKTRSGYIAGYNEEIDGEILSGSQIVTRVAQEFSVNPRLLLAVLEYRSGWVTQSQPKESTLETPIVIAESWRKGLYLQLAYAANNLNRGFYLWRAGAVGFWILKSGEIVPIDAQINAGTAGVQQFFALLVERPEWDEAVGPDGLYETYSRLFGFPFARVVEPVVPSGLVQPEMQLPFEAGETWLFTGGPHGGWGDGSAWAALDFAPEGEPLGCVTSDKWVVAVADGAILRTGNGVVIQDLDMGEANPNDGFEQTGWVVLYMHIESRDRVLPGTYLRAGERIGHPSCEGGLSSGTHVHLARRYNGEWITADGKIPFVLDGWVSSGDGVMYDGYLTREGVTVEAWEGNFPENRISR